VSKVQKLKAKREFTHGKGSQSVNLQWVSGNVRFAKRLSNIFYTSKVKSFKRLADKGDVIFLNSFEIYH
jgi:hypothetical protein